MIKTFSDKTTAAVFADERVRQIPTDIIQAARRKLNMLDKAVGLMICASHLEIDWKL